MSLQTGASRPATPPYILLPSLLIAFATAIPVSNNSRVVSDFPITKLSAIRPTRIYAAVCLGRRGAPAVIGSPATSPSCCSLKTAVRLPISIRFRRFYAVGGSPLSCAPEAMRLALYGYV